MHSRLKVVFITRLEVQAIEIWTNKNHGPKNIDHGTKNAKKQMTKKSSTECSVQSRRKCYYMFILSKSGLANKNKI